MFRTINSPGLGGRRGWNECKGLFHRLDFFIYYSVDEGSLTAGFSQDLKSAVPSIQNTLDFHYCTSAEAGVLKILSLACLAG
jgi:hypothetical protein